MGIIPTRVHGVLDYLVGLLLIASPWLFAFAENGAETWVPVLLGAGAIAYSLITDYELGVIPVIKMPVHLALDAGSGLFLAASPWIFSFDERVWIPHVVFGLLEIGAAAMTRRTPERVLHSPDVPTPRGVAR